MSIRDDVVEALQDPELLFADGFDDAILGFVERFGSPPVVLYDRDRCIAILQERGMELEEAHDYFDHNVAGAWLGHGTPAFATLSEPV